MSGVKAWPVTGSPLESCAKILVSLQSSALYFRKGHCERGEQVSDHMFPSKYCPFDRKTCWRMLIESLFK